MFISNNHTLFHLWSKEILVKPQEVSKYYENDCRLLHFLLLIYPVISKGRGKKEDRQIRITYIRNYAGYILSYYDDDNKTTK